MNNMVIIDYHGLLIYINTSYLESYYDMSILWHLKIYQNKCSYFTHGNDHFEYLLGDLKCVDNAMEGNKSLPHMQTMM